MNWGYRIKMRLTTLVVHQHMLAVKLLFDAKEVERLAQDLAELRILLDGELRWNARTITYN